MVSGRRSLDGHERKHTVIQKTAGGHAGARMRNRTILIGKNSVLGNRKRWVN